MSEANMRMILSIVKVTPTAESKLAIGKDGTVLLSNSTDLKNFKKLTSEVGYCLCGRKTWEDWRKNLKEDDERKFIVLTHNKESLEDDSLVYAVADNVNEVVEYVNNEGKNLIVCGGATVYEEMKDYVDVSVEVYVNGEIVSDSEDLTYYELNDNMSIGQGYPCGELFVSVNAKDEKSLKEGMKLIGKCYSEG
jgi:dihydrofolate reductase